MLWLGRLTCERGNGETGIVLEAQRPWLHDGDTCIMDSHWPVTWVRPGGCWEHADLGGWCGVRPRLEILRESLGRLGRPVREYCNHC